jgi:Leucine-rich repeat (LRR) protein
MVFMRININSISRSSSEDSATSQSSSPSPLDSDVNQIARVTFSETLSEESNANKRSVDDILSSQDSSTDGSHNEKKQKVETLAPSLTAFSSKEELEAYLEHWGEEEPDESLRYEAAENIVIAFEDCISNVYSVDLDIPEMELTNLPNAIFELQPFVDRLTGLKLFDNYLTSLPLDVCGLRQLQELSIDDNQITTLPKEIGNLRQLRQLSVNGNQLTTIPSEIGNLLQLNFFSANRNQLTSLTPEIWNLRNLDTVFVNNNQLITLPPEIGNLRDLQFLDISHNPRLSSLPISLGYCQSIIQLTISDTAIDEDQAAAILEAGYALRRETALVDLPEKLLLWYTIAGVDPVVDLNYLSDDQKVNVQEWLFRLESTSDFNRYQVMLAKYVCGMLDSLANPAFRETFFVELTANLTDCGDRAAMLFNILYTSWKLETINPDATVNEKCSF